MERTHDILRSTMVLNAKVLRPCATLRKQKDLTGQFICLALSLRDFPASHRLQNSRLVDSSLS